MNIIPQVVEIGFRIVRYISINKNFTAGRKQNDA